MVVNWTLQPVGDGCNDVEPDEVVWVDVMRLEAAFRAGDQYVGRRGSGLGQTTRYQNVGRHIMSGREIWMPFVTMESGNLRFVDGRHRFAWVRDHGAVALPVATGPDMAGGIKARFGSLLRICQVVVAGPKLGRSSG